MADTGTIERDTRHMAPDDDDIPSVEEITPLVPPELERYEIVDGAVVLTMVATDAHQHVITEFGYELVTWARPREAVVRYQPTDVRTTRTRQREPDILVVLAEHRDRIRPSGVLAGAPDLVVEVLSRSTRHVDLGAKRAEYAGIGVPEYVCVDPVTGLVRVFTPDSAEPRLVQRDETFTSTVLDGFSVPLDRVLPPA